MRTESIYKTVAGREAIMAGYDRALAAYFPPHEIRTIATRYGETAVIVAGDPAAAPLVLLHGAGSNSAVWAADVQVFAPHFCVYAVDLVGEPGKSAATRPPWDGPAFAEWLGEVLDGLGVERAALLGLSQGGWTALRFATRWPERAERLVLLAPGGVVADRPTFLLRAVGLSLLGKRGIEPLKRAVLGDTELPPELDDYLTLVMSEFKPRVGALPLFSDEELARLTMPVLFVGGEEDAIRDEVKIAARLETLLPELRVVLLPGVGHTLTETTPYSLPFLLKEAV